MSGSSWFAQRKYRILFLVAVALVFGLAAAFYRLVLDETGPALKIHLHLPFDHTLKPRLITFNQDAIDLLESAEHHDQSGEPDLASMDYRICVNSPDFKRVNGRPRLAIEELADTRKSAKEPDYFGELVSHSRITYWPENRMPIKVYIPAGESAGAFSKVDVDCIKSCFDEWVALVPKRLSYKLVLKPEDADIVFSQAQKHSDLGLSQTVMAHTVPVCEGPPKWRVGRISKVNIDVVRLEPPIQSVADDRMPKRHAVFLHEIGHALGLDGHSCNGSDMMFFQNVVLKMTDRDRQTFKLIYQPGLYERAEKKLKELAAQDDKYALIQLASVYREAGSASPEKIQEVFRLAKKSADLGLARAQLWVGYMYANGDGVKRDLHKAAEYYQMAATQDIGAAFLELANLYEVGEGVVQDVKLAQEYLRRAVSMDAVPAELAYADLLCYEFGDPESYKRAVTFYKLAATKNSGQAFGRLAKLYKNGYGVERDEKQAAHWMQKAMLVINQQKPQDAEDYFSRGLLYHEIHMSREAIADLSRALELRPAFRNGYLTRAMEYDEIGEHEKALQDYTSAIMIDPDCLNAYYPRCLTYLCLNQPERCLQDVEQVLRMTYDPDFHRMYAMLYGSFAYKMMGNKDAAKKLVAEASKRMVKEYWPAPIVQYLNGEIKAEELLKQAQGEQRGTEARAFLGVDQALSGDLAAALKNLKWVKEYGDGHFYEYPIAVTMLERIEKSSIAKK